MSAYRLLVALPGRRLVGGEGPDKSTALLMADASMCRLYDFHSIGPSAFNDSVTTVRKQVASLDLTQWPDCNVCHVIIIKPVPPGKPDL